jgi:hypothetical protein
MLYPAKTRKVSNWSMSAWRYRPSGRPLKRRVPVVTSAFHASPHFNVAGTKLRPGRKLGEKTGISCHWHKGRVDRPYPCGETKIANMVDLVDGRYHGQSPRTSLNTSETAFVDSTCFQKQCGDQGPSEQLTSAPSAADQGVNVSYSTTRPLRAWLESVSVCRNPR